MAKISFDLESNSQAVIDDWSRLNSAGEELNQTTKDFGTISNKAFDEANKSADKFGQTVSENIREEQKEGKIIDETRKSLQQLGTARDKSNDTSKISAYNKKLEEGKKVTRQVTTEGKEGFDKMGDSIENTGGKFGSLTDLAGNFGVALGIGAIIGGIVAVGQAVSEAVDRFRDLRGEVSKLTGLTGDLLDSQVEGATAIADTYEIDVLEVIRAANVLSNEFGLTQAEALEKVKNGALGVAGETGELIEQTKEYASQIRAAGGDADTLFNIINKSATEGIFSDKGVDAVKEFNLRIREQTTSTGDALRAAFGDEFTDRIFGGINDGSLTSIQALEQISVKLNDTTIPANELQTVIADVFGGAGEDAGLKYLQSLTDISGGVEGLIDETNVLTRVQLANLNANERLATAQNDLSKLFDSQAGNTFFTQLQALGFELIIEVINPLIDLFKDVRDSFSPLINILSELGTQIFGASSEISAFDVILAPFKLSLELVGFLLNSFAEGLTFLITGFRNIVSESPFLTSAFEKIGEVIRALVDGAEELFFQLSNGFDEVAIAGARAAKNLEENYVKPVLERLEGLNSRERDILKERLIRDQQEINSKLKVLASSGLLDTAAAKELEAKKNANGQILSEIKTQEEAELKLVAESEDKKLEVRKSANKKAIGNDKKAAAERLKELEKIQGEFNKALERLAKESEKIELDNLSGPAKFKKIKENSLAEIKALEELIIEKGKLLAKENGEVFELAQSQLDQLEILRTEAREKEIAATIKFNNDKKLAEIGDQSDSLDVQEGFAVESVRDVERVDTDLSIVDFELFKQEELLRIQEEFATKRIELLQKEIDAKVEIAEQDGTIDLAEQNEIDKLRLQQEGLNNFVEESKAGQQELANQRGKFSMAEFLGVSNEDLEVIKDGLNQALNATVDQIGAVLDAQAEAAQIKVDSLQEQEDSLRDELETELELNEAGFASNVEGKRAELAQVQAAKVKAQKDAEAVAKKQFILDTALQTQGLITSSIRIIEGFSKIPVVGLPLGIAAVASLFAFFASAKAQAFSAIGNQAATGASGKGKTGTIHGRLHSQGGENFTDHLEVERDEGWGIISRSATKKHGDVFHKFTEGLNAGRTPDDLMQDMLHGTGVYMKSGIDSKISNRGMVIKHQEVVVMAQQTNSEMQKSMNNLDRNLEEFLGFEKSKIRIINTPTGRWEINDSENKKKFVKYTNNESEK